MRKKVLYILIVCVGLIAAPTIPAVALNYGAGNYGACQYNTCSITISSYVLVNLDLTPVATPGTCTIQSGVVSVLTDDSSGYTLTMADSSASSNALINGSSSIAATRGTFASPAPLGTDTWGYRVDGVGSFGAGPTSSESNSLTPSSTPNFALVQQSPSSDTIQNTSSAADPAQNTTFFYGACADTSISPGIYTSSITYTAVTN